LPGPEVADFEGVIQKHRMIALFFAAIFAWSGVGQETSCYDLWIRLREQKLNSEPMTLKAKDTETEMAFAFE
jgi:hypothetical protein